MSLSLRELEKVFTSWQGNSPGSPGVRAIKRMIEAGYLSVERETFDHSRRDIDAWVSAHRQPGMHGSNETHQHVELKLIGAWFLEFFGHEMEKEPLREKRDGVPLFQYSGDCFESRRRVSSRSHHQADVVCHCEDHTSIVEAGYTPARRFLKSVGYARDDADDYPVTPEWFRREEESFETFYVIPYGQKGPEGTVEVYGFSATDEIPEPKKSEYYQRQARMLENIVDGAGGG